MECQNCFIGQMQKPSNQHPSYLECPNCGSIELTYVPQDYQEGLHAVDYEEYWDQDKGEYALKMQIIGAFGGYGSGKSRSSLTEVLIRALENPNGTGLLTAPTLQQLKRTTIKTFFNEVCPPPLIEGYNKSDGEIRLINGFTFYTIPSDDEEKLRSINAGIIHMEEASGIKRTIYDQLLTRMRDPFVRNRCFMVCSNPDLGWIKEIFADNPAKQDQNHPEHEDYNPYVHTFIWATKLNKHLPQDFIEINSKGKPDWWIKRYLEGSFDHSEGMVYPMIMNCFIDPYPVLKGRTDEYGIPMDWERFVTLDHGLRNPTAVYFHAIDPIKAEVVTYNEYYKPNTLVPEHAKALKPEIDKIPRGRLRFMVADPSIKNKTDPVNGKSVQALYQEYDLFFSPGNNSIEAGVLRVNSYIERGKWKIYRTCVNLMKEGIHYKFPELDMDSANENLDEKPVKANDHAMDSCFVAGTLIETINGQVPIEKIKTGDYVLTRNGYKKVIDWGITNKNATVYTVHFSNGCSITATGNHPIFVEGEGFCTVDSLRYGDIIKVSPNWEGSLWLKSILSNGTIKSGEGIPNQNILATGDTINAIINGFIEKYGRIIMERFLKDFMFTIRMKIPQTMISKISNWSKRKGTWNTMQANKTTTHILLQKEENIWKKSDQKLSIGTNQKRVMNGIKNMEKVSLETWKKKILSVIVARNHLGLNHMVQSDFVPIAVSLNGEEIMDSMMLKKHASIVDQYFSLTNMTKNDIVPVHVVSVATEAQKQTVYNLSVEDLPEYYANGVLVHNCRYGFMRLPDNPDLLALPSYTPQKMSLAEARSYEENDWTDEMEDRFADRDWTSFGY